MMLTRAYTVAAIFTLWLSTTVTAQPLSRAEFDKNGEVVLAAAKNDIPDPKVFNAIVSIDHKHSHDSVYFYVMLPELDAFNSLGIPFSRQRHPNVGFEPEMIDVAAWKAMKSTSCGLTLSAYPTYGLYETMMADFASDFPEICRLVDLGTLPSGRKILALRITDHPDSTEAEPRFLYTSTMHGDETAGYILMLRFIRELLCNYGSDARITHLVNNVEIWINPLANPDGTYHWGNHTVSGARRGNANNIDLNRNFPDPQYGQNPNGVPHQPETVIFMDFAEAHPANLSSNLHGGIELIQYPWDTYAQLHADDAWWIHICREYADTAQAHSPPGYFTALNNGITNGYAWYSIAGGRQDYITYFRRGRETTLELTNTKLIPTSQFESRWNYNRRSFFNYLEQALYGLRGIVTDANTGEPLQALVGIQGHDIKNASVYSQLPNGNYHRYLKGGTWSVSFAADGYLPQTHEVSITDNQATILNVALVPEVQCTVQAGVVSAGTPLTGICTGDGIADLVQVSVSGHNGLGRFGLLTNSNEVVASNQTGAFNMENYPAGTYRIGHIAFDASVSLSGITHLDQLEGCYALSNAVQFTTTGINGGSISALGASSFCAGSAASSQVAFGVQDAAGPNRRWVLLTGNLAQYLSVQTGAEFDLSTLAPGQYKVAHIAYANGVNLGEVVLPNLPACMDASNVLNVQILDCNPFQPSGAETIAGISLTASPNPVANIVNLHLSTDEPGTVYLSLLDLSGRIIDRVYHADLTAHTSVSISYDMSLLPAGVYICRAESAAGIVSRRIVKW